MKFPNKVASKLRAFLLIAALLTCQEQPAAAQINVENIAKRVTVLITRPNPLRPAEALNTGTGVIVDREGNTYQILTAKHVLEIGSQYTVVTPDGTRHAISSIIKLPETDLALLELTSQLDYESIQQVGDSDLVTKDEPVYIYGWPTSSSVPQFSPGKFVDNRAPMMSNVTEYNGVRRVSLQYNQGYDLVYRAKTYNGMSGGPVFNKNGQLIGIHGRDQRWDQRAISINAFLNDAANLGLMSSSVTYLKVCNKHQPQQEIDFAFVKYAGGNGWLAKGWLTIPPNDCRTLAIADGYQGKIYYYAKLREGPGYWGKGPQKFCVREEPFVMINSDRDSCQDKNQKKVPMTERTVDPGPNIINIVG